VTSWWKGEQGGWNLENSSMIQAFKQARSMMMFKSRKLSAIFEKMK